MGNIETGASIISEAAFHRTPAKKNDLRDVGPHLEGFREKSSDAIPRIDTIFCQRLKKCPLTARDVIFLGEKPFQR